MFSRRALSISRLGARSLHSTRKALQDKAVSASDAATGQSPAFHKISKSNVHVLDSATLNTWQEIPKGGIYRGPGIVWKIWYNHAIIPLYAVSIGAASLTTYFMYRYFGSHTEIAWGKTMRGTYDHTGLDERRADKHSKRLLYSGIQEGSCKREVNIFPFNFVPMQARIDRHKVDYPDE